MIVGTAACVGLLGCSGGAVEAAWSEENGGGCSEWEEDGEEGDGEDGGGEMHF